MAGQRSNQLNYVPYCTACGSWGNLHVSLLATIERLQSHPLHSDSGNCERIRKNKNLVHT
jgi:hypothetical protein